MNSQIEIKKNKTTRRAGKGRGAAAEIPRSPCRFVLLIFGLAVHWNTLFLTQLISIRTIIVYQNSQLDRPTDRSTSPTTLASCYMSSRGFQSNSDTLHWRERHFDRKEAINPTPHAKQGEPDVNRTSNGLPCNLCSPSRGWCRKVILIVIQSSVPCAASSFISVIHSHIHELI